MTGRALLVEPALAAVGAIGAASRLHAGSEHCPWLLPAPEEFAALLVAAREGGVPVTLVTPWLPGRGLDAVRRLVEEGRGTVDEVVVNDWGLLRLAVGARWPVRLFLGRLLLRSIAGRGTEGPGASEAAVPGLLGDLGSLGLAGVLLDALSAAALPAARRAGLRVIWVNDGGLVTVAGRCPWRYDGRSWGAGPCPRPCRAGSFELVRPADGLRLLVRGRGQFLAGGQGTVPEGVDRVAEPAGGRP